MTQYTIIIRDYTYKCTLVMEDMRPYHKDITCTEYSGVGMKSLLGGAA